jgi:hypothetical protein
MSLNVRTLLPILLISCTAQGQQCNQTSLTIEPKVVTRRIPCSGSGAGQPNPLFLDPSPHQTALRRPGWDGAQFRWTLGEGHAPFRYLLLFEIA